MRVERLMINPSVELAYFVPRDSQFLGAAMSQLGAINIDWFVSRKAGIVTITDASSKELYDEHDRLWFYLGKIDEELPDEYSWMPTPVKFNDSYLFYALRSRP